jgi:hypothetical protein
MAKETFGSQEEGFDVSAGDGAREVHVRAWGFWSAELSARFSGAVIGACASTLVPVVTIDATDLKPMRDAGQEAFGTLLAALPIYRVKRVVVTTAGALTKLQLLRIAKERSSGDLVQFVS